MTRMYIFFLCKDHLFLKPRKTYSKIDVALCETHTHVYAQMLHKMSDKCFILQMLFDSIIKHFLKLHNIHQKRK